MNVPFSTQSAESRAVYETWVNETKDRSPRQVQDRIWLNDTASFEDAVSELIGAGVVDPARVGIAGYRSEEHTSELQSLMRISYAVFCLKKKTQINSTPHNKH